LTPDPGDRRRGVDEDAVHIKKNGATVNSGHGIWSLRILSENQAFATPLQKDCSIPVRGLETPAGTRDRILLQTCTLETL
jgi:hypothetical protein